MSDETVEEKVVNRKRKKRSRGSRKMTQANRVSKKIHYLASEEVRLLDEEIAEGEAVRKALREKEKKAEAETAKILEEIEGAIQ